MKNFLVIQLLIMFVFSSQAQISTNKKVIRKKGISTSSNVLTRVKVNDLKTTSSNKKIQLAKLQKLEISDKDLKRRSYKRMKISPTRPAVPGLNISYHGMYNKDYFRLLAKPSTGLESFRLLGVLHPSYDYIFLYSADLTCNIRRGKEYRMTIKTELERDGIVVVNIGGTNYYQEALKVQNEIVFVFWSQQAGYMTLKISPLIESRNAPYKIHSLPIKSIQVDEI